MLVPALTDGEKETNSPSTRFAQRNWQAASLATRKDDG